MACGLALLAGAAHADALDDAKATVDGRMTYQPYVSGRQDVLRDYKAWMAGEFTSGNCLAFAISYMKEAARRGVVGSVQMFKLDDGRPQVLRAWGHHASERRKRKADQDGGGEGSHKVSLVRIMGCGEA